MNMIPMRVLKLFKQMMIGLLLLISLHQLTTNFAEAQYITNPTINALGGAGAAARGIAGNMLVNPATLALMTTVEVEAQYRNGDLSGGQTESFYGLSLADNTEDVILAGGLSYLRGTKTFRGQESEDQFWNVSLAKRLSERLVIGGSLIFLDSEVRGQQSFKQYNGTLGAMVIFNEDVVMGLVLDSFISPDEDVPLPFRLIPTNRLGIRWTPQDFFSLRADVSRREHENPDGEGAIHLGMESFANKYNILRLGARIDDFQKQNFLTLGWGFNGPRLRLNYSFEKPLKNSNGAMHSVDLLVAF